MLKVGKDDRVPMMVVYDLFLGKCKPADVMAAAEAGECAAERRKQQLFYAHLYLGLYYDVVGDKTQSDGAHEPGGGQISVSATWATWPTFTPNCCEKNRKK